MASNQNIWDILGKSSFNTHVKEDEIDPRAADNILIAWPPILELIQIQFTATKDVGILDFGCGTGGFCNKLNKLGYKVTGIDTSKEMINTAKTNSPPKITYIEGDQTTIPVLKKFNVVTTIMTLQFIENIEDTFKMLKSSLEEKGILIIVDFNRDWVKESLKLKAWFAEFDSTEKPTKGLKTFGNLNTKVFIRDAKIYDALAIQNGLVKILESKPTFTKEFVTKYPSYYPNNVSEYLILAYQKK